MCNLNCLFVKKKQKNITPFLMAVSSHSFVHNNDGEGIYFNSTHECIKSKNKTDYTLYTDKIEASSVVITHQRLCSSGRELIYNHPFCNEEFVLIHNGVINQFMEKKGSDTFGLWNKFNAEFKAITSHFTREQKLVKVVAKLFTDDKGTYSILIYDKKTKKAYYFKNDFPTINFYKNENYLYISTSYENKIFLSMLDDDKYTELKIEARKIYKITPEFEVYEIYEFPVKKEKEKESKVNFTCEVCDETMKAPPWWLKRRKSRECSAEPNNEKTKTIDNNFKNNFKNDFNKDTSRLVFCVTCSKFSDNINDYIYSDAYGGYLCEKCNREYGDYTNPNNYDDNGGYLK